MINLLWTLNGQKFAKVPGLFSLYDILKAKERKKFSKAIGADLFDGKSLMDIDILANCRYFLFKSLNEIDINDYLKESRLILISKSDSSEVPLDGYKTDSSSPPPN